MDHLPNPLAKTPSTFSTGSLMQPSAAQVEAAKTATKRIMSCFPDYGKAPPDYMVALMDCLTWLSPEELAWVTDPRNGLTTVCKFLPTPGDVHEFIRAKREKAEQFRSHPTSGYKRLMDEAPDPRPPTLEERKAVVLRGLGYDPQQRTSPKRELMEPTAAEVEFTIANLKTPSEPISDELRQLLAEQDAA